MFEQVLPNLFVFYSPNQGANSYLLVGKKILLIDSGLKMNATLLKESLETAGVSPNDIELICHTHGHADHFSADYLFKNADVMMHAADAQYVNIKDEILTASAAFGNDYYPKISSFLADGMLIDSRPFSLRVMHTPGHTRGSVCFYDAKQKLLFSGDTIFNGSCGRFDLPLSTTKSDLRSSIQRIAALDFSMLLPGHGNILKERQKENISAVLRSLE